MKVPPVCWDGLAYYSWFKFCFIGKKTPLEHFLLYKHKSFPFVGPFCCAPMFTNEISSHLSTDVGFEPNLLNSCACYLFFSFSILMARYITFRTFVQAYFFFLKKKTPVDVAYDAGLNQENPIKLGQFFLFCFCAICMAPISLNLDLFKRKKKVHSLLWWYLLLLPELL